MDHLRFVHAADLHLDRPFCGISNVAPRLRDQLQASTYRALARIVDHAIGSSADFVLLAGDLYDSKDRSLRALVEFRKQMERLAEHDIPVLVVHGNHDPLNGWGAEFHLPPNVVTFGGQVDSRPIVRDGRELARVTGVSYTRERVTENLASSFRRSPGAPYAIALLHANVGSQPGHANYAPASLEDLLRAGFDYWALGHVHTQSVLATGPAVVYPGTPQGRNIREAGPRGCYRVDVDSYGRAHLRFIETDVVRWASVDVPIGGHSTMDTLLGALSEEGRKARRAFDGLTILRATLTGSGPLHRDLQRDGMSEELRAELESVVAVESVRFITGPGVDFEALAHSETLAGDLVRLVERVRKDPSLREQLADELRPLFQRRELASPDEACLMAWIENARNLGVDLLLS